ncbi:MAG: allantoicase [Candidatus Acidiferrales bacterium]
MKDFSQLADLASERLGGRAIEANDEFFAPKENLLKEAKPVFIEGKYTARGKWMDGWETRRRRKPGHDWCIVRLGLPEIIRGVVVDTSFFKGNYPERFWLEGCDLGGRPPYKNEETGLKAAETRWIEVIPETKLQGDAQNSVAVNNEGRFTHLRLNIYPDGGVARLRVHGEVVPDKKKVSRGEIDLAAVENGGSVIASSDQFFGAPRNLLMPGRAKNMGDGWETKRRRGPGHDWVVLKLGVPGVIRRIEVDTTHFKGNFPESCSMEACYAADAASDAFLAAPQTWKEPLPRTKLKANHRHVLKKLQDVGATSHVRFHIYPDGGVSRLRLFGRAERAEDHVTGIERFKRLSRKQALKALFDCCGAKIWAKQMAVQMPFASAAQLLEAADNVWAGLEREDWLEAFRHHPAIGEKQAEARQSANARRWSAREQSAAQKSPQKMLAALAAANREYHAKFGHVFLICAAGKSSEEILKNLHERMSNNPEAELRIAAEEQRKITRLRLEKLLAP